MANYIDASTFDTELPKFRSLEDRMGESVLKDFVRGRRRYFPLSANTKGEGLEEAFFIIFGRPAKDDYEVGLAILFHNLDNYIEEFDGKIWVRTIVKIK